MSASHDTNATSLEGAIARSAELALERVAALKYQAKLAELNHLKEINALQHLILNLEAEIVELESVQEDQAHAFELNRQEIKILEKLIAELYVECEQTRIPGYTDDQMFEANAANEFTVMIAREIQSEIIANGRPSPAKLLNAMSNPHTLEALKSIGLVPKETILIGAKDVPLQLTSQ